MTCWKKSGCSQNYANGSNAFDGSRKSLMASKVIFSIQIWVWALLKARDAHQVDREPRGLNHRQVLKSGLNPVNPSKKVKLSPNHDSFTAPWNYRDASLVNLLWELMCLLLPWSNICNVTALINIIPRWCKNHVISLKTLLVKKSQGGWRTVLLKRLGINSSPSTPLNTSETSCRLQLVASPTCPIEVDVRLRSIEAIQGWWEYWYEPSLPFSWSAFVKFRLYSALEYFNLSTVTAVQGISPESRDAAQQSRRWKYILDPDSQPDATEILNDLDIASPRLTCPLTYQKKIIIPWFSARY